MFYKTCPSDHGDEAGAREGRAAREITSLLRPPVRSPIRRLTLRLTCRTIASSISPAPKS